MRARRGMVTGNSIHRVAPVLALRWSRQPPRWVDANLTRVDQTPRECNSGMAMNMQDGALEQHLPCQTDPDRTKPHVSPEYAY
jgi:hypothetical protein